MGNNIRLLLQYLAVIAPACSFIVATISIVVIWYGNRTSRVSNNAWEVCKQYTSEEIKRARITVRTLMEDPKWRAVTDYRSYRTYFQLDASPRLGSGNPKKQQDIEMHSTKEVVCQEVCKISAPGCLIDEAGMVSLLKCKLRMTA